LEKTSSLRLRKEEASESHSRNRSKVSFKDVEKKADTLNSKSKLKPIEDDSSLEDRKRSKREKKSSSDSSNESRGK
jgi:hypothetical protein